MAAMATFSPGVRSAQAGMSLTGAVAVCAKVTEGTEYGLALLAVRPCADAPDPGILRLHYASTTENTSAPESAIRAARGLESGHSP
jgi:hypothetical protein